MGLTMQQLPRAECARRCAQASRESARAGPPPWVPVAPVTAIIGLLIISWHYVLSVGGDVRRRQQGKPVCGRVGAVDAQLQDGAMYSQGLAG